MACQPRFLRAGFTIVQLLVILVLLLFLFALLVPVLARVRDAAARSQSGNDLRQLALASHSFHDTNRSFPPGVGSIGEQLGTTHFFLLPYVEQDALYRRAEGAVWK